MNWLGFIAVMALAAIILSVVTGVEMTKCQSGSAYAMMRFCKLGHPGEYPIRMQVSRCGARRRTVTILRIVGEHKAAKS